MESSDLLKVESYIVPPLQKEVRLSDLTAGTSKTITSRKGFKNAIKQGLIKINGKTGYTADYIRGGEVIEIYQTQNQKKNPTIELELEVVFEDEHLAVINKPAGIIVSGNKKWTLENALSGNLTKSTQKDALQRPEPIHRLDYPTTGALLIGKTAHSLMTLNKLFEERKVEKIYYAVTIGTINDQGVIDTNIEDKSAITEFNIIHRVESTRFEYLNLVKLIAHTGRKHQLRIHMASIGNPILGDLKYRKEGLILKGKGLYLQSSSLKFIHPITAEPVSVKLDLPKKFRKIFPDYKQLNTEI